MNTYNPLVTCDPGKALGRKNYLLTPGPTPIPHSVSEAMARPLIHHRSSEFQKIFKEIRSGLKYVFQTQQDVLLLSSSGTGAMEACVSNLFCSQDEVIVIHAGKFGRRWSELSQAYGLVHHNIHFEMKVDVEKLREFVSQRSHARAIFFQACETSTGMCLPVQEIVQIAQQFGQLSICDAISGCGAYSLPMDEWGLDVMIAASQKSFKVPPGLAMMALSEKAWRACEQGTFPRYYFDLRKEKKAQLQNLTAWTPSISLIYGLHQSLKEIQEEGLDALFAKHEFLARAMREGIKALGLEILAEESASPSMTAIRIPEFLIQNGKASSISQLMKDRYGVIVAGGQDEWEGKILRLSHMGHCEAMDIIVGISALEMVLHDLGYPLSLGKGVGAAMNAFICK